MTRFHLERLLQTHMRFLVRLICQVATRNAASLPDRLDLLKKPMRPRLSFLLFPAGTIKELVIGWYCPEKLSTPMALKNLKT